MSWLFVPGMQASNSDCDPLARMREPFVMWRGKPMQPPRLRRAWRTVPWMRRLSGLTCAPSTAALFADWWIASLAATPASHSASQEADSASMTLGTSGPTSPGSLARSAPSGVSSRTCAVMCRSACATCDATWNAWVTELKRGSTRRRKLARRTSALASSSWPTPTAQSYGTNQGGGAGRVGPVRPSLDTLARIWSTPCARDWKGPPGAQYMSTKGKRSLPVDVQLWPTPTAGDSKASGAAGYATEGRHSGTTLTDAAVRGFRSPGPQVPTMQTPGGSRSVSGRTLNPRFVEWLMGWPIGWSDCEAPVTESFREWRRLHGAISTHATTGEGEAA